VSRSRMKPRAGGRSLNAKWLIDCGCGWDLVDRRNVVHLTDKREVIAAGPKLWTANGVVQPSAKVPVFIPSLRTT